MLYAWTNAPAGSYALTAVATDNQGATATSATASITIATAPVNEPPTVSLSDPANGTNFEAGSPITMTALASDNDGSISKVEFFQGLAKLGEAVTAPYTYSWANAPVGNHTLTAIATDNQGATATSAPVTVTVTLGGSGSLTLVLQDSNGMVNTTDTYLSLFHQTRNFGASPQLLSQASQYPLLVRFAVFAYEGGPLPNGAVIESARLAIYKSSNYDSMYQAVPLLVDWSETAATWNLRLPGIAWAVAGAAGVGYDTAPTADAQASIGWNPGWLEFNVTDAVQAMSSGRANYGWKLIWISGNNNLKNFASREGANPSLRPKLTVVFQNP